MHICLAIILLIVQHLDTRVRMGRNTEALCSRSQKMFKIATLGRKIGIGEDFGEVGDNKMIRKIRAIVVRGGIFAEKGS